jgi:hypothetical protein
MSTPVRDYPAAHSMDSTWFAVDADGEVALFDTGEGGSVPAAGFPMGGEMAGSKQHATLEEHELLAHALLARARSDERLRALLPADPVELARIVAASDIWDVRDALLRAAGIWTYSCEASIATPYVRAGTPARPLLLPELDAEIGRRFGRGQLPVRFREAPAIAPGELVPVQAWGPIWIDLQGQLRPTADSSDRDVEAARAELAEWGDLGDFAATEGEALDDERFYAVVATMVATGRENETRYGSLDEPRGGAGGGARGGGSRGGGVLGWLVRLFRGR